MSGNGAAKSNRPGSSWAAAVTQDLDSPEVANNFLKAISFAAVVKGGKPSCKPSTGLPPHLRHVKPRTDIQDTSGAGLKPKEPATPTHNLQPKPHPSASQWTTTNNQLWPLNNAQGIEKKTADPSRRPRPYYQEAPEDQTLGSTVWPQASNETSAVDPAQSWGGSPVKAYNPTVALPKPEPKPNNSPISQVQPGEFGHTARPSLYQSFVPADPKPTITTPEAQEHRLSAVQECPTANNKVPNSNKGRQREQVSGPDPIDPYSLDLTAYRMPRPDKNYAGSWPSPPPSISTINVSETGLESTDDKLGPDIRNIIALENDIHKSGNTWYKCNWNHLKGTDDNDALRDEAYMSTFMAAWTSSIPDNVKGSFGQANALDHWRCDLDTNTGSLLPPVSYPDTMADPSQMDKELEWNRLNLTSTLLRQRKAADRPPNRRNWGNHVEDDVEDYDRRQVELEVVDPKLILKICDERYEKPEFNEFVPRIPCFLRPAEKYDMEAVRLIHNWEVEHGLQTVDSQPLPVEVFEKILSTAQQLGMPFIVAVRGSARKLGLTKGNLSYSTYRQRPTDESDPRGQRRGEILGFAFLSVWEPGLGSGLGSGLGTSRATAKINVYVHPDYRKKKIGFSLLDMLLTTVSDRYSSQSGYDFVDPDNTPVYKGPGSHERQYYRLYFHYLVKHKQLAEGNKKLEQEQKTYDDDLVWIRKMLDEQLGFTELVRFEAVHRSAKCRNGPVYWLDQVVFEHACHFAPGLVKDDY